MEVVRGKRLLFLGMTLSYEIPGVVKVMMDQFVESILNEFPDEKKINKASTPDTLVLF